MTDHQLEQQKEIRVLLADDQAWLRSAVKLLLEQEADFAIVGEAGDVPALINLVRDLLGDLRRSDPHVQIIVLSGRPEASRSALATGASAFVSKAAPPEQLMAALHKAKQSAKMQSG
jgi:DNA-binding NarL/FixJ family response regulator